MFFKKQKPVVSKTPLNMKHEPVQVNYDSNHIDLPDDFLVTPAADSRPITFRQIDWANTEVPEFKGGYAIVLDNVLSRSECRQLLAMAESSVVEREWVPETLDVGDVDGSNDAEMGSVEEPEKKKTPWRPAMVNIGGGYEILEPTYRNSDRIVWDHQQLMDRLWEHRLSKIPKISGSSSPPSSSTNPPSPLVSFAQGSLPGYPPPTHWDHILKKYVPDDKDEVPRWDFVRMNKRMRFLRYGRGNFFRAHCDGAYTERDAVVPGTSQDKKVDLTTHFTLQLYLNDSQGGVLSEIDSSSDNKDEESGKKSERNKQERAAALAEWEAGNLQPGEKVSLVGGATSFLSTDEERRLDVHPLTGRVLIFQHKRLYHAGDDVLQGVKYAMRAELMYQRVV